MCFVCCELLCSDELAPIVFVLCSVLSVFSTFCADKHFIVASSLVPSLSSALAAQPQAQTPAQPARSVEVVAEFDGSALEGVQVCLPLLLL